MPYLPQSDWTKTVNIVEGIINSPIASDVRRFCYISRMNMCLWQSFRNIHYTVGSALVNTLSYTRCRWR